MIYNTKASKKSLNSISITSNKRHDIVAILSLLEKCTQILKDDRTFLHKRLKEGDITIESLLNKHKKKPDMSSLQQDLRKLVQKLKNKPQNPFEMPLLTPIYPQNLIKKPLQENLNCNYKGKTPIRAFNELPLEKPLRAFNERSNNIPFNKESDKYRSFSKEIKSIPLEKPTPFIKKQIEKVDDTKATIPLEITKKSPLLQEVENHSNLWDLEQNTILKVNFEGSKGFMIPEVNLSKELDENFDCLEKIQCNLMSFKQFSQTSNEKSEETMLKGDLYDKMQKLSYKEEDYFDKSVIYSENPLIITSPIENPLIITSPIENCNEISFEEAKNNIILPFSPPKPIKTHEFPLNPIQNSINLRFSRPYDLKPDERDHYIDEIYLKFKFDYNLSPKDRFQVKRGLEEEKQLFLGVKFDKGVIERMQKEIGLETYTPEAIIEEIFNVQSLSKISKTFFKIKMQALFENTRKDKKPVLFLLNELFELCDLRKDGFLDINEMGFCLDVLCLRKDYDNIARVFFDVLDKPFKRVLTLENLLSQIPTEIEALMKKFYYESDRESKGFITYWDVYQMKNSEDLIEIVERIKDLCY